MKSSQKTLVLLIITFILAIFVGSVYTFLFVAMKRKTEETADFLMRKDELSGKESRSASALASMKGESENISKLSTYFIKESEIVLFTKKIESLGPASGTTLSLETLEPGMLEGSIPILNLRIKADGKFKNIMQLVALLENYPAKLEWKSINFVRDDKDSVPVTTKSTNKVALPGEPLWTIEMSLNVFNFIKE